MTPVLHLSRRRNRGFTLIELLVAIAILGILGTVVIKSVWKNVDEAKQTGTKTKVDQIHDAVMMFRRKHNGLPKWPEEMLEPDIMNNNEPWLTEDEIVDAWGRQMELKQGDKAGQFEVVSLGADGTPDGEGFDRDISSARPLDAVGDENR